MRPALFISDLHLCAERPELVAAFDAFCAGPARKAAAVYILGDLFDVWLGDDQLRNRVGAQVARSLRALSDAGVAVHVMRGNRDFLLGERFAQAAGATLLPEQIVVDVAGVPTLLLHGDELCTADVEYQRFRSRMRSPRLRLVAGRTPWLVRTGIARLLRSNSKRAATTKPEAIMDVTAEAVAEAFRAHGIARMVHGHTHRPARHELVVDGTARERFVLADWYGKGSYLEFRQDGYATHEIAG